MMKLVLYQFGFIECMIFLQMVVLTWTFNVPLSSSQLNGGTSNQISGVVEREDESNPNAIEYNKRYQFMTPNQWVDKWKKSNPFHKRSFSFSTPNAWADKWKKSTGKRSFSFSAPNSWAEKWKKSLLDKRFSFSTPNSWADQWKRNQGHDAFAKKDWNDSPLAASGDSVCTNLHTLTQLQQLSQSALKGLLDACDLDDTRSECLIPEKKAEILELYDTLKMRADVIDWCRQKLLENAASNHN